MAVWFGSQGYGSARAGGVRVEVHLDCPTNGNSNMPQLICKLHVVETRPRPQNPTALMEILKSQMSKGDVSQAGR